MKQQLKFCFFFLVKRKERMSYIYCIKLVQKAYCKNSFVTLNLLKHKFLDIPYV